MKDKQMSIRFYIAVRRAGFVRQIAISRSKAVVTYYPRKTARRSYTRELIRQRNHVWRAAHISSLSTIFREMWRINSRSPCRNGVVVRGTSVAREGKGSEREREMWPSSPIRSTAGVDAADTRARYSRHRATLGTQCCNTTACARCRY